MLSTPLPVYRTVLRSALAVECASTGDVLTSLLWCKDLSTTNVIQPDVLLSSEQGFVVKFYTHTNARTCSRDRELKHQ